MLDFWTDASKHTIAYESRMRDGDFQYRTHCTCGYTGIPSTLPVFAATCPVLEQLATRADRLRDTHPEWKAMKA